MEGGESPPGSGLADIPHPKLLLWVPPLAWTSGKEQLHSSPYGCAHTTRGAVQLCPAFTGAPSPSCCPQSPGTAQHPTGLCASCLSSQQEWTVPPLHPLGCERLCFPHSNFFGHLNCFLLPFPCLCSEEHQAWEQSDPQRAGRLPGHCTVTDTCCGAAPVTASPGAEQACALFGSQARAALPHSLPGARHKVHSWATGPAPARRVGSGAGLGCSITLGAALSLGAAISLGAGCGTKLL